jgi:hypothetical protein
MALMAGPGRHYYRTHDVISRHLDGNGVAPIAAVAGVTNSRYSLATLGHVLHHRWRHVLAVCDNLFEMFSDPRAWDGF